MRGPVLIGALSESISCSVYSALSWGWGYELHGKSLTAYIFLVFPVMFVSFFYPSATHLSFSPRVRNLYITFIWKTQGSDHILILLVGLPIPSFLFLTRLELLESLVLVFVDLASLN